ncbi:SinI family restriction endonuclease [Deinococcus sp.]|uniref:SinI family restriction endonuclease n=1 Tax=Deinococcus sp. TaxID=47478 RepID=UPI0025C37321|nr:SinI family restriction endonuclease [Deinococcus sp.]
MTQAEFMRLARAAAQAVNVAWTPALEALVTYGLQSPSLSAFARFGRLTIAPDAKPAEAQTYFQAFLLSHIREREGQLHLREVSTVADPAVDVILAAFAGMQEDTQTQARLLHRQSMAAENLLGALLERYLARELEPHGWVWCAGNTIRAVDFIRLDLSLALQVKNRSNSENSSSSAIRVGTEILKWYRVNANTGRTNWEKFPAELPAPLSEEGFHDFIREYAKGVH